MNTNDNTTNAALFVIKLPPYANAITYIKHALEFIEYEPMPENIDGVDRLTLKIRRPVCDLVIVPFTNSTIVIGLGSLVDIPTPEQTQVLVSIADIMLDCIECQIPVESKYLTYDSDVMMEAGVDASLTFPYSSWLDYE